MSVKSVMLFFATAALLVGLGACSHTTKNTDSGVDLQANWGGVEFIKDRGLNKDTRADEAASEKSDDK